jgi:hypothetical protein
LAPNQNAAAAPETTDDNLSEQIWVAEKVGELLAANHWISTQANGSIFRENVRQLISAADCTLKWLREVTHVNVRVWLSSMSKPRIDSLIKLCCWWRFSPLRFLTEPIPASDDLRHFQHIDSCCSALRAPTETVQDHRSRHTKAIGYHCKKPSRPHDPQDLFPPCRQAYRLNEAHSKLEAALLEDPAPAFFTVLKRLGVEPQAIRETFPRICRCIRDRYKKQKADARSQEHNAFEADVRGALVILQHADVQPTYRRILATIKTPRFRSRKIIDNTISLVREKLSSGSHTVHPNPCIGSDRKSVLPIL